MYDYVLNQLLSIFYQIISQIAIPSKSRPWDLRVLGLALQIPHGPHLGQPTVGLWWRQKDHSHCGKWKSNMGFPWGSPWYLDPPWSHSNPKWAPGGILMGHRGIDMGFEWATMGMGQPTQIPCGATWDLDGPEWATTTPSQSTWYSLGIWMGHSGWATMG